MRSAEDLARAIFEGVTSHDLDTLRSLDVPDLVDDFVALGIYNGRDAVLAFFTELWNAFPDFTISVVNVFEEDDTAVLEWEATGTFTGGPFRGFHPTGRPVHMRGCYSMRFEGRLLKRNTISQDGLGFARQIGFLPAEDGPADLALKAVFNARTDALAQITRLRG